MSVGGCHCILRPSISRVDHAEVATGILSSVPALNR